MIVAGRILAIPRANIDTDQIIPAHYLTSIDEEGMGQHCMSGMPDGAEQLADDGGAHGATARLAQ